MNKMLTTLALAMALSGCAVYSDGTVTTVTPVVTTVVVEYETAVISNGYYLGYYRPGFGYWTGYGWDMYYYQPGHRGHGHYYRGAPPHAREYYYRHRTYGRPHYDERRGPPGRTYDRPDYRKDQRGKDKRRGH